MPHPSHLRLVPSELHLAHGALSLLDHFEWRRLVVLSENTPIFASVKRQKDSSVSLGSVSLGSLVLYWADIHSDI